MSARSTFRALYMIVRLALSVFDGSHAAPKCELSNVPKELGLEKNAKLNHNFNSHLKIPIEQL